MKVLALAIHLLLSIFVYGQVGINTNDPQTTLDVQVPNPATPDSSAGIGFPQVTILPSSGNKAGQVVYHTIDDEFYYYDGIAWFPLKANVDVVQDLTSPNNGDVLSTAGLVAEIKDLFPKTWEERDNTNRNFSSTWATGFTTQTVTIRDGFDCRYRYELPSRNDQTSWGGGYTLVQISVNGGAFQDVVDMGYQQSMVNGGAIIHTATKTVYFDRGAFGIPATGDYTIQVRLRHRSYSGTLMINGSRGSSANESASLHEFSEIRRG